MSWTDREYEQPPIPADDWYAAQHAETIATQGADPHAGCSIYNATSMCVECDSLYADLFLDGEYDFAEGIALEDGFRALKEQHPELPTRADGPIAGFAHGWSAASLRSQLRIVDLPFTRVPARSQSAHRGRAHEQDGRRVDAPLQTTNKEGPRT